MPSKRFVDSIGGLLALADAGLLICLAADRPVWRVELPVWTPFWTWDGLDNRIPRSFSGCVALFS